MAELIRWVCMALGSFCVGWFSYRKGRQDGMAHIAEMSNRWFKAGEAHGRFAASMDYDFEEAKKRYHQDIIELKNGEAKQ